MNKGVLYIVSTPIGNPEDISLRAIQTLRSVDVVAAEDSRIIGPMLVRLQIDRKIYSLRGRPANESLGHLTSLLAEGRSVALVSDAGTPLIADPGAGVVESAIKMQCSVVSVPGATAAIAALTVSGLSAQRFVFEGFPPRAKADRVRFFAGLHGETRTMVLFETTAYLANTLNYIQEALGDARRITVSRDLTRDSEATVRGSVCTVRRLLGRTPPRGEYAIVIEGVVEL